MKHFQQIKNFFQQFQHPIKTKVKSQVLFNDEYYDHFFSSPLHQWLKKDSQLIRVFLTFLADFDVHDLQAKNIRFVALHDPLGSTIRNTENGHLIILQPELIKLLKSADPQYGMAILAHEMGHIMLSHSEKEISSLSAQIEADRFAFDLGYGKEMIDILSQYQHEFGCEDRLAKLNHWTKKVNVNRISA